MCTDRLETQANVEESNLTRWLRARTLLFLDRSGISVVLSPVLVSYTATEHYIVHKSTG